MAATYVNVFGSYINATSNVAATGTVKFKPRFTGPAQDTSVTPTGYVEPVEISTQLVNGGFSVNLRASDDSTLSPTGWTYRVTEEITGFPRRQYDINVPSANAGSGLNLVGATQVTPPNLGH